MYKLKRLLRNKKALTALQTAILTGVGIAVALIVGYWVWTVVVGSIRTERLNLTIPSATFDSGLFAGAGGWEIKFKIKNVGPSDATIVDVRINGKSYADWGSTTVSVDLNNDGTADDPASNGFPITAGGYTTAVVQLKLDPFKHGQTVEIAVVTASNQVYTASVSLP